MTVESIMKIGLVLVASVGYYLGWTIGEKYGMSRFWALGIGAMSAIFLVIILGLFLRIGMTIYERRDKQRDGKADDS